MATPLRKVFGRIPGLADGCTNGRMATRNRQVPQQRDSEQEEFQHANSDCLSSYYSVFVARLAIMVMLTILIGLLTILTWHITKSYTAKSLNNLAYGLRYEILQRPVLRMWNILNSTVDITTAQVKLSEYIIRQYDNSVTQAEQVERYESMRKVMWALFASRRALDAITINYRNGFVQAFHRDHRSNNAYYIYSDLTNYSIGVSGSSSAINMASPLQGWDNQSIHGNLSAIWYQEPLDPTTGDKIGKARQILPDDLINIAGLSQVPDGVASWHVAVSKYSDSPLLSAALPVWDPDNESIVAVVGVTTAFYSVGQLMRELVELHGGHIYLTSHEGYLLATSTNTSLLINSTKGPELMMAVDSQEQVISLGAQWLKRTYGNNFPTNHEVHAENARLADQQYYIDSFFLNLKRLPIVGVIILPRKYIMGKVDERAFKTMVILISSSLSTLVVGCICIFLLTNGVSKEMKLRAELISHLNARRKAEASSNYKSQFLANMSHELRTPMAAVIGLLDILICDDCLSNEQYATVTQIRKCSTALLRLLNNILDLSKVESGKLVLEEAEFNLSRELEGLVDMFSVQCFTHDVETILDLSDNIPTLVLGDSARVVQIFANLISNSMKFTTSGHILIRGWCEAPGLLRDFVKPPIDQRKSTPAFTYQTKMKHIGCRKRRESKNHNEVMLCFEIDDTGCGRTGIDPSKWESVFESFEQADPSTTRLHGGTGLGLCIVRTLVKKMGGEIKVAKKNGPGTLMRLYLVLHTTASSTKQNIRANYAKHDVAVLLAVPGSMSRSVMSGWLCKNGMFTLEASEWNGLTQIIQELLQSNSDTVPLQGFDRQYGQKFHGMDGIDNRDGKSPVLIIVIDIGLLDLSTEIWKEQLRFLDKYRGRAKLAWMLNHDTSNVVKMELRKKGHLLMINKPLYKAKMIQILDACIKERNSESLKINHNSTSSAAKYCPPESLLEIDAVQFDGGSSDDSSIEFSDLRKEDINESGDRTSSHCNNEERKITCNKRVSPLQRSVRSNSCVAKESLDGLRILLAEDTPVLQRVASIMLEKLGARVLAVGDGLQAVKALNCELDADDTASGQYLSNEKRISLAKMQFQSFDLILMDCQMPKMDGYEATKLIRKFEDGTGIHIPIVALTAHAMSSDEAKCLEVGMDAYLTKPIDYDLMVSTILSLTRRKDTTDEE
ncbi:hypothetical protein MLD38_007819 [Melastoma candidum]|uniref:Uncharacterized protein n=1 Tax=Melastoma candidum TaxID=119954 RepID=A0ACB9RU76_9MYRT|nr:hypothetical protein MLD38_007819 [Melastoma candidum]